MRWPLTIETPVQTVQVVINIIPTRFDTFPDRPTTIARNSSPLPHGLIGVSLTEQVNETSRAPPNYWGCFYHVKNGPKLYRICCLPAYGFVNPCPHPWCFIVEFNVNLIYDNFMSKYIIRIPEYQRLVYLKKPVFGVNRVFSSGSSTSTYTVDFSKNSHGPVTW